MHIGKVKAVIEKKKPSGMKFSHAYGKNKSDEQVFISISEFASLNFIRKQHVRLNEKVVCGYTSDLRPRK